MKILLMIDAVLPVEKYGGTERVAYGLGKYLSILGHSVSILCRKGSVCPFAKVVEMNPALPIEQQIPEDVDVVHFNNYTPSGAFTKPFVVTFHGNGVPAGLISPNSVFVSRNHANRHGCDSWVYNGLDWDDYGKPDLSKERSGFHFLGNAAWRVKNVKGAIDVVKAIPHETLEVMGGTRFNIKMGVRFTFSPRIHFHGMVDNAAKSRIISRSKGLIFPVTWHEPFGLCLVESMYYGSPVFATPYGAIPELVTPDVGLLTNDSQEMIGHLKDAGSFDPVKCHEYAADNFNAKVMAENYLKCYEKVLNGEKLISTFKDTETSDYRNLLWK
ncbi:MAG: glycosyltransferase [Muribaculaceae bacterium]|nr:glycosyltransferase [Muribaculaceae bacterium]